MAFYKQYEMAYHKPKDYVDASSLDEALDEIRVDDVDDTPPQSTRYAEDYSYRYTNRSITNNLNHDWESIPLPPGWESALPGEPSIHERNHNNIEDYRNYQNQILTSTGTSMAFAKISVKQIDTLAERLEAIEKKVFGDYQAQKIQKKTDGAFDFENDVALFFQHDISRKEWQNFFKEYKIDISAKELSKIAEKYSTPKQKEL